MKKCLVTLTIGDDFKRFWKKYFEHRLDEYATRHGYDIVAIDDYIDTRFSILWDDSFFESYPFRTSKKESGVCGAPHSALSL